MKSVKDIKKIEDKKGPRGRGVREGYEGCVRAYGYGRSIEGLGYRNSKQRNTFKLLVNTRVSVCGIQITECSK